jgi:hypothetical protein
LADSGSLALWGAVLLRADECAKDATDNSSGPASEGSADCGTCHHANSRVIVHGRWRSDQWSVSAHVALKAGRIAAKINE